uniref:Uncharacterized protein n=1 Tax=Cacopsylla melanoneura TaxID=428564 RepID=A0A8D8RFF9_9HEMI
MKPTFQVKDSAITAPVVLLTTLHISRLCVLTYIQNLCLHIYPESVSSHISRICVFTYIQNLCLHTYPESVSPQYSTHIQNLCLHTHPESVSSHIPSVSSQGKPLRYLSYSLRHSLAEQ